MKMQNAEMEFVAFDAQDVIATSGERTITISNFYDGEYHNGTIIGSDGTEIYDNYYGINDSVDKCVNALNTFFGTSSISSNSLLNGDVQYIDLRELIQMGEISNNPTKKDAFNGVFEWLNNEFVRVNQ